jgi:hypothetical protein
MKTYNRLSRRIPASGVHDHKQPQWWLAPLSPLLTYINMRTLALLMFVSFAVLNTTHGNDGETKRQVTGNIETQVITNRQHDLAQASTPPTNYTTPAPSILWQLTERIVQAFTAAINDPSLIEYANQQGTDIPDLQKTPCQGATRKTSTY